jgi:hypothetical protein
MDNKMTFPIVVSTCGSNAYNVMKCSIETYYPEHKLYEYASDKSTFGESYNYVLEKVFNKHEEVIIANDDVVLRPDTIPMLMEDVVFLKQHVLSINKKLGYVAACHDVARPGQDIRVLGLEYKNKIIQTPVVAPMFAYMTKSMFEDAPFPPINWYSDDVNCEDLIRKDYVHFISRAYCPHVGSTTIGHNHQELHDDAWKWVVEHRPEYVEIFNKRRGL